ncbi:hypothetical protein [Mesorhizobium sp.]|uniref:hypothetical protein n=1 Tax=Mesorhizobium sp. TaxID=1871066 RepID=UPI000FE48DCD|nr:hypothetical protein [Mesorhizobium sp.]RWP99089.1 MAG: hypothetical protein EOR89_18240 [Mesorhizobium sp.]RWQ27596.1 MAG: hypothetical protein EOS19_19765 [Mesorhizobium sp.]
MLISTSDFGREAAIRIAENEGLQGVKIAGSAQCPLWEAKSAPERLERVKPSHASIVQDVVAKQLFYCRVSQS